MDWSLLLDACLNDFYSRKQHKSFKILTSNYDRIAHLINLPSQTYLDQIDQFLASLVKSKIESKSVDLSEKHKLKGNGFYAKSEYTEAFKYYTLALSHASNFKAQVLSYSNRSAVFNALKLYRECMGDIEAVKNLIISTSETVDFKFLHDGLALKLLNREINCLNQLKLSKPELNEHTNPMVRFLSEKLLIELKETIRKIDWATGNNVSKKLSQNEGAPSETKISECVLIQQNLSKGRYCVANRDIQVGEYLFVEKSYCAILLPEFNEAYCQQCFKLIYDPKRENFLYLNIQVCDACTSVFYCSVQCKLNHKQKHLFECKVLKCLMHNLGIAHLAYRILATTDFNLLMQYSKEKQDFDATNIDYNNSSDYVQIFHLLTHEKVCTRFTYMVITKITPLYSLKSK
jgi:hypothetical protein